MKRTLGLVVALLAIVGSIAVVGCGSSSSTPVLVNRALEIILRAYAGTGADTVSLAASLANQPTPTVYLSYVDQAGQRQRIAIARLVADNLDAKGAVSNFRFRVPEAIRLLTRDRFSIDIDNDKGPILRTLFAHSRPIGSGLETIGDSANAEANALTTAKAIIFDRANAQGAGLYDINDFDAKLAVGMLFGRTYQALVNQVTNLIIFQMSETSGAFFSNGFDLTQKIEEKIIAPTVADSSYHMDSTYGHTDYLSNPSSYFTYQPPSSSHGMSGSW